MSEAQFGDPDWRGPWNVTGPWHHDSGYPQTWVVQSSKRTICECPTERGAHRIAQALAMLELSEGA